MFERRLRKHIRYGRLVVRGLSPFELDFGNVPPERPDLDVSIRIGNYATACKLSVNPDLHFGEAYTAGSLTIERGTLRALIEICLINLKRQRSGAYGWPARLRHRVTAALRQRNGRKRATLNVARHYDLSEDLYRRFLDDDRQYSCAYFDHPGMDLAAAQESKKALIAKKLLIRPGDRILDIGCGWGGLAMTLGRLGASNVTGITLSPEQLSVSAQRADQAGLNNTVHFSLQDYRDVQGKFDRIASVGMFEHVGVPNYQTFFDTLARLLAEDGVAVVHSIGRMDGPGSTNSWIQKHIFPGGYAPALSEVIPAIERAGLWITDIEVLRLHYAETLVQWQQKFAEQRAAVAGLYDEAFCRMWEFYLAASEMAFRHDGLMVFQIQLAKRVDTVPITRNYLYSGGGIGSAAPTNVQRANEDAPRVKVDLAAE